jgi:hypothetical protein
MNNKKTLTYYILLNILISALTTLTVLWIWDRVQLLSVKEPLSPTPTRPIETVPVPSITQEIIKIDNVFGMADLENEVVLLKRVGEGELWLTGWQLKDTYGHTYTFPTLLLNKDGAIQVYTRSGTDTAITLYWGLSRPIWNSGDTVVLYDPQGNLRAQYKIP